MCDVYTVYFAFPSLDGTPAYHFVGVVSNAKPSAIFKVSGLNFGNFVSRSISSIEIVDNWKKTVREAN